MATDNDDDDLQAFEDAWRFEDLLERRRNGDPLADIELELFHAWRERLPEKVSWTPVGSTVDPDSQEGRARRFDAAPVVRVDSRSGEVTGGRLDHSRPPGANPYLPTDLA